MKNVFKNIDCMEGMAKYDDKYFDLAIVDPPYGIGDNWNKSKRQQFYGHKNNFNDTAPAEGYFNQLFRVSKNQIIWGGNYYCHYLPMVNTWIFWDKQRNVEKTFMSEGELAWTSFSVPMRKIKIIWDGARKGNETGIKTIHPQQKPIELYRWLLKNYAKKDDEILDTHVGSASSLIACIEMGFEYTGFELDKDYYNAAYKRIKNHTDQLRML